MATGQSSASATGHRSVGIAFLDRIDTVPLTSVHVILGNVTYKTPLIRRWLVTHRYRHFRHERLLDRLWNGSSRSHRSRSAAVPIAAVELERASVPPRHPQRNPRPFIWTKSADQILANMARFCQRTLDSGH